MQTALEFLRLFPHAHVDWLMRAGTEQAIQPAEAIIRPTEPSDRLFLVLEGLFGVYATPSEDGLGDPVATVGAGDLLGLVAWFDNKPPSSSVVALEPSVVLALDRKTLREHEDADPDFAAHFNRAAATALSMRLRMTREGHAIAGHPEPKPALWKRLEEPLARLRETLHETDKHAAKNDDEVSEKLAEEIGRRFSEFTELLNETIGDGSGQPEAVRDEIGLRVQREFLPYLLLTKCAERWYSKPRGYAGDFLTIEQVYQHDPGGTGRIGPLIDRLFLAMPAAVAVRNRRGLLATIIRETVERRDVAGPAKVTSLACGPAREVFEVFEALPDRSALRATLLDIDMQALAFVADRRDRLKLKKNIHLLNDNLIQVATGRSQLPPDQDLIYSIGLIDYFADSFVISLLKSIHAALKPGGRVVLGNFHPRNPTKAVMDYVLDWRLIHRTEEDMNRLFRASAFRKPASRILFEDQRINLFAECVK